MEPKEEIKIENDIAIMHDRIINSGRWFFWISILSLVNIVFYFININEYFVLGMGIPYLINGILQSVFNTSSVMGLIFNIIFIGFFVYVGYLSIGENKSGFIAGLIIYLMDTIFFIAYGELIAIAFHLVAIFMITRGFLSLIKLEKIREANISYDEE